MRKFLWLHILIIMFSGLFNSVVDLLSAQAFLLEIMTWVEFLFCILVGLSIKNIRAGKALPNFLIILMLVLTSIFSFIVNHYSISLYLMGLRSAFKYFVFFLNCVILLEKDDVKKLMDFFYYLLIGNVLACTAEYFVLGYRWDYCCGLFGIEKVGSYMNVFIVFMSAYAIAAFLRGEIALKRMMVIVVGTLYISILGELKFFFFEFAIVVLMNMVFYKPNKKTFLMAGVGVLGIILLPSLVSRMWMDGSADYLSIEGLMQYFDTSSNQYGYASKYDLGRIGGISKLNKSMFSRTFNLFGYGLGYCDYGSSFLKVYEYLHYIWFTYLLTYLELGYAGLILYLVFLGMPLVYTLRYKKRTNDPFNLSVLSMVFACTPIAIILLFYNTTFRNVPAYIVFMFISFAYIISKERKNPSTYERLPQPSGGMNSRPVKERV